MTATHKEKLLLFRLSEIQIEIQALDCLMVIGKCKLTGISVTRCLTNRDEVLERFEGQWIPLDDGICKMWNSGAERARRCVERVRQ